MVSLLLLLLRRALGPSLNGGAAQLCALQWKGRGLEGREGGRGEEGRAQPKSGGPASPKGETLLAYMRGSKRKETAKAKHKLQRAGTAAPTGTEGERGGAAVTGPRRGGGREAWADEISWNSALAVRAMDGNTGAGIPNACQTIIARINYCSVLSLSGSTFSSEERIECSSPFLASPCFVFLPIPFPSRPELLSWSPIVRMHLLVIIKEEEFFFLRLSSCAYSLGGIRS